jgi:hypothetical protein
MLKIIQEQQLFGFRFTIQNILKEKNTPKIRFISLTVLFDEPNEEIIAAYSLTFVQLQDFN